MQSIPNGSIHKFTQSNKNERKALFQAINLWIENLLEIEKINKKLRNTFYYPQAAIDAITINIHYRDTWGTT